MGGGVGSVLAPEIQPGRLGRISGPLRGTINGKPFQTKLDIRAGQFFLNLRITFTGVKYDQNEPLRLGLASFGSNLELLQGPTWAQISGNTNSIFITKK